MVNATRGLKPRKFYIRGGGGRGEGLVLKPKPTFQKSTGLHANHDRLGTAFSYVGSGLGTA